MAEELYIKDFSEDSVRDLIREIYGLEASVTKMAAERDFNYLVKTGDGTSYVFKISNPEDSREIVEAQHQVLNHLGRGKAEINCPQPVETRSGETISRVRCGPDRKFFFFRLLTFLEGRFYSDLETHSPELEKNLGEFLGTLGRELKGFYHPVLNRYFIWDLKNVRDIRPLLQDIPEILRRNLVLHFIQMVETVVEPLRHQLPCSVIHNDANDHNILVDDSGSRISGLIDFGDMVYSQTVNELAAGLAYAIMNKTDPIETMVRVVSGYHKQRPLTESEIEVLFFLVAARLCISVALSAHRLNHSPENKYLQISTAPAWETLERMSRINPCRATRLLRRACGYRQPSLRNVSTVKDILKKRKNHIGSSLSISYQMPIKMTGGYMQYLFDDEGKTYLDTVNNVCHVGHCHPRVVEAAQRQFSLLNTNTRYLYDSLTDLAESLCSTLPEPLRVCYFVNSGSEANELALRIAKTCTGHRDFVVIDHAYHGNTNAVIEISPYKFDGPGGTDQSPHVHKVRMPDTYRGEFRGDDPEAGLKYSRDIDQALRQIKQNGKGIAGFIAESISGVGGQIFLPAHYLESIYEQVRKAGGLCIADEVQVGFGRVGSHFWAFELQDVVPDIVTMGKPMGNGHPIAAVVTTTEIDAAFNKGMEYFNTFGGNPVACTIGLSVLEVIRSENLQHQAKETGNYFLQQLTDLMEHHPLIGDVRGKGLFIGIELVLDRSSLEPAREQAYYIANRMKENGILISIDGPLHNVIKIKPPLVFNKKDANRYVGQLDRILNETNIGLKRSR